jgi:hypothetical protein
MPYNTVSFSYTAPPKNINNLYFTILIPVYPNENFKGHFFNEAVDTLAFASEAGT